MTRFIEIQHDEWVAAAPDVVREHYADLHHRLVARVHPHERVRMLPPGAGGPRFECIQRAGWRRRRDVLERQYKPDGSIIDTVVAGSNWGRSTSVRFWRRSVDGVQGTLVEYTVTQPLRPPIGALLVRWARRRIASELATVAGEDKADVERGYAPGPHLRVA